MGAAAGAIAFGDGPKANGDLGIGQGLGDGQNPGRGGNESGFTGRGTGHRKGDSPAAAAPRITECAVTAALIWLANHQNYRRR